MPPDHVLAAPFHVFVLVCDRDEDVGPGEVLAFQKILARPPRRASPKFTEMLAHCREGFSTQWSGHASATLRIDLPGFVELMDGLEASLTSSERKALAADLAWLAKRLHRAGYVVRPAVARKRAYEEFRRALRERIAPPRAAAKASGSSPEERVDPPRGPGRSEASVPPPSEAVPAKGSIRVVCTAIRDEARGVRTFSFASVDGRRFSYRPGQFVTIEPRIGGRTVARSYTISSTPTRPPLLEITVKRVLGGVVSNWMHDHMRVGDALDARGPFGKFSCVDLPSDKYLFLGAGSGVTPLMSMLRYLHDGTAPVDVVFLQSAKAEGDLVFRDELARIAERDRRFRIVLTLTSPPANSTWEGRRGRLENAMLHEIAPDLSNRTVLACGPAGFLDKAKRLLAVNGFPMETLFHEESFVPRRTASPLAETDDGRSRNAFRVRFLRSGKTVEIFADETILDAAERCGLSVPSACRQGRCGTCRVPLVAGEVTMPEQEALGPEEVGAGEILACIGQPASGTIEVDL